MPQVIFPVALMLWFKPVHMPQAFFLFLVWFDCLGQCVHRMLFVFVLLLWFRSLRIPQGFFVGLILWFRPVNMPQAFFVGPFCCLGHCVRRRRLLCYIKFVF